MMNPDLQKSAQWILGTWPIRALLVSVHDEIWGNLLCHWCWAYSPDAWTLTDSGPVKGVACNCLTLETCVRKNLERSNASYIPLVSVMTLIRPYCSSHPILNRLHAWSSTIFHQFSRLKHLNKVDVQPIGFQQKNESCLQKTLLSAKPAPTNQLLSEKNRSSDPAPLPNQCTSILRCPKNKLCMVYYSIHQIFASE